MSPLAAATEATVPSTGALSVVPSTARRAASTAFWSCVTCACAWASCAGSTVGVGDGVGVACSPPSRPEEPEPPVDGGSSPASTLVRFAWAAVSEASSCWSVTFASVVSTLAGTWPLVTLSPGLTSTSVSVPPVVKFSPASLGEVSVPEPDTVATTVPLVTVATRGVPLPVDVPPSSSWTAAYAPPAPARTTTPSTELIRAALCRRGSTFMARILAARSFEALGENREFAGSAKRCSPGTSRVSGVDVPGPGRGGRSVPRKLTGGVRVAPTSVRFSHGLPPCAGLVIPTRTRRAAHRAPPLPEETRP